MWRVNCILHSINRYFCTVSAFMACGLEIIFIVHQVAQSIMHNDYDGSIGTTFSKPEIQRNEY